MRKHVVAKKLRLNRETLRLAEAPLLAQAAGGSLLTGTTNGAGNSCATCPTFITCIRRPGN
jgi:hypothetical protein